MRIGRIRIGEITHERGFWGKDYKGQIHTRTSCGVFYTYYPSDSGAEVLLAVNATYQDVDCMTCLVAETRR